MTSNGPNTFIGIGRFQVTGMTCEHCQRAVTTEISRINGVEHVDVDLASGTVTIDAGTPVTHEAIASALDEAGYRLAS